MLTTKKGLKKTMLVLYSLVLMNVGAFLQMNCAGEGTATGQPESPAASISYNNSTTGMTATTVQAAIDELRVILKNTARTDFEDLIVGTWKGDILLPPASNSTSTPPPSPQPNFQITFKPDGTYVCEDPSNPTTTLPNFPTNRGAICPSGTWIQRATSVFLSLDHTHLLPDGHAPIIDNHGDQFILGTIDHISQQRLLITLGGKNLSLTRQ